MTALCHTSLQDALRTAMAEDALRIAAATAHWRDDPSVGRVPSTKGRFHVGSAPAKLFEMMVPGEWYCSTRAGAMLGLSSMRAGDALRQMARSGHVTRRDCPDLRRPMYARPK